MKKNWEELLNQLNELEDQVNEELKQKQKEFHYSIKKGKLRFEKERKNYLKKYKKSIFKLVKDSTFMKLLTAPFIYFIIIPGIFIDLSITVYQAICFPVYGIKKVKRSQFIVLDRHHLTYLNTIEKINCLYCGYINGVIAYIREVASRTEQYWCPVKHAFKTKGRHKRQLKFMDFGDGKDYQERLNQLREQLIDELSQ